MSLATRCTFCNTVFRVTQDHLNVSAGWVRCGQCREEFNGLDQLFDLEVEDTLASASERAGIADFELSMPDADAPPSPDSSSFASDATAVDGAPGQEPEEQDDAGLLDPVFEVSGEVESQPDVLPDEQPLVASDEDTASAPAFIRQSSDHSPNDRPSARIAYVLLLMLLSTTLLLQCAFHFRDTLAEQLPQTRATLIAMCKFAGCRIEAPRSIGDVVVESSALTHEPRDDTFRLVVVMRNRGTHTLAMPSVELTLTDSSSRVLARRALMPTDFNQPAGVLMPGIDTAVELVLTGAKTRTTGYTVEAFYP